jgi:RNA polymerase sigma factor (sigma-70 family)
MRAEQYRVMSDQQLLDRYYERSDSEALGHLLQRYTFLLLGVSMKYLKEPAAAEDVVQQVYLKVLGELTKYRVTYFSSWIYQIVKNQCLMQLREQKKWGTPLVADTLPMEGDAAVDLEYWMSKEERFNLLTEALEELSEEQKTCVSLFYLDKMSYRQISERTGYPIPGVKSHIQNGKRNLRIALSKKIKDLGHD